jgi:hypothetical protein
LFKVNIIQSIIYVIFNWIDLIKEFDFKINGTNSDKITNPTNGIDTEYKENANID